MDLTFTPKLSEEPRHHPDCCVAVSRPFLVSLLDLLPKSPALVLSIGSGSGYLEASLLRLVHHDSLNLMGVEVSPRVNKYLPEQNFVCVEGTWDMYANAGSAQVLLFVYPREPRLMARYLQQCSQASCQTVIWIGPSLDWPDYEAVLQSSVFTSIACPPSPGSASYEMLYVATKITSV